jgi:hypothetical protein
VSLERRMFETGNRLDIRWLSGRGNKMTSCVFPLIGVAVMEKYVTLAVTGNTISGRVVWRQRVLVFPEHRLFLTGSR